MRPDTWSADNAAGKYAGQPLKASCASYAEGLAPHALCPYPNPKVATLMLPDIEMPDQVGHDYQAVMPGPDWTSFCPYTPPTNPNVATLIRTEGGKAARKAVKQA